jgi:hypothetical protein
VVLVNFSVKELPSYISQAIYMTVYHSEDIDGGILGRKWGPASRISRLSCTAQIRDEVLH